MEVEGNAAGGRAAAAHVDCCVFCVLCGASGLLVTNITLLCGRLISDRPN